MSRALCLIAFVTACSSNAATPPLDAAPPDAMCYLTAVPDGAPGECIAPAGPITGGAHVIFLNFNGATIYPGSDDALNNSSSIPSTVATIPPYLATTPDRLDRITQVTTLVRETFAPYDVDIVTARPSSGDFNMIMFGGPPSGIGVPNTYGAAPNACGVIPKAISFVFDTADLPEIAHHMAVAMALVPFGFTPSSTAGDCMCNHCDFTACGLCTLHRDAKVGLDCPGPMIVDEPAKAMAALGCRP